MHRLERFAELSPDSFEPFVTVLWDFVQHQQGLSDVELPDGVGELDTPDGVIEYAVSRPSLFAALRWREAEVRHEAFCVQPDGMGARVGHVTALPETMDPTQAPSVPAWWAAMNGKLVAHNAEKPLPSFLQLVAALTGAGSSTVTSASVNAQLQSLTHELAYFREFADDQGEELRQLRIQLRDAAQFSYRSDSLTQRDDDDAYPASVEPVEDLRGLPQWAQVNEPRIVVLPRALNGGKKSIYKHPAAVYRALEYLAGPYRDYRLNRIGKPELDEALVKAGMKVAGSVALSVAGEQGEAYYVSWDGRRRFLEHHLVRGGGRDERYCLRVYYFWDDASQRVVVGWLPSHLSNSLS